MTKKEDLSPVTIEDLGIREFETEDEAAAFVFENYEVEDLYEAEELYKTCKVLYQKRKGLTPIQKVASHFYGLKWSSLPQALKHVYTELWLVGLTDTDLEGVIRTPEEIQKYRLSYICEDPTCQHEWSTIEKSSMVGNCPKCQKMSVPRTKEPFPTL